MDARRKSYLATDFAKPSYLYLPIQATTVSDTNEAKADETNLIPFAPSLSSRRLLSAQKRPETVSGLDPIPYGILPVYA